MHTDAVANVFMTLPAMKTKGGQMEIIKLKSGECCCCLLPLLLLLMSPCALHIKMSDTLQKTRKNKEKQRETKNTGKSNKTRQS